MFFKIFFIFFNIVIFAQLSEQDTGSAGEQPASNKITNGNILY